MLLYTLRVSDCLEALWHGSIRQLGHFLEWSTQHHTPGLECTNWECCTHASNLGTNVTPICYCCCFGHCCFSSSLPPLVTTYLFLLTHFVLIHITYLSRLILIISNNILGMFQIVPPLPGVLILIISLPFYQILFMHFSSPFTIPMITNGFHFILFFFADYLRQRSWWFLNSIWESWIISNIFLQFQNMEHWVNW